MIEPLMFAGIGFIAAALLVLGIIPLVHNRAVRLTRRRLEALTPLSMAEIQAEKDQLRAEFAMSTRRLEMTIEQLKAKTTGQLADIGKKAEAISRLKLDLGEKTAALFALEAKEKHSTEELTTLRAELNTKQATLEQTTAHLATAQAEVVRLSGGLNETSAAADTQRVELLALRAQAEAMEGQLEAYEQEMKDLRARYEQKTSELDLLNTRLREEGANSEQLTSRIGDLDRALVVQKTESEVLARRVEELNARLQEQGRLMADGETASDRLRNEAAALQKDEVEARSALAAAESRHRAASQEITREKALLEEQLRQAHEECGKLEHEIVAMKQAGQNGRSNEHIENAVLRERINDVAAEVARLTAALEGPDSPVYAILNSEGAAQGHPPNGANGNAAPSVAPAGGEAKGTLADRIRALQSHASRLPQANGA
ncbi:MAG: hypothetical protein ACJ8F3_02215 [Xanthobacteraceae bacterium]